MSYAVVSLLESDAEFQARVRAVVTQQATVFLNDQRPDFVGLAMALLRFEYSPRASFTALLDGSPGFSEAVDNGDGTIDQGKISDADLLAATQSEYPTVVGLFFDSEGNRLPGTGGPT